MDYYSILGINRNASAEEIKQAYRRLASKHHPDKGGDTAHFQQIQEAYATLGDEQKRAQYDNPQPNIFNNIHNINDIFQHFGFNPFGDRPFHQNRRKNNDLRIELDLSLEETLTDQSKTINIRMPSGANKTYGIKIPKGVTPGTTIKYPNMGEDSIPSLPNGDLLVTVRIYKNEYLEVHGLDLYKICPINALDVMIGCEITVESLDKTLYTVTVPAGSQNNTKFKIPGKGLPGFQVDIQGNFIIVIDIKIPSLNEKQKQLVNMIKEQG
jgi:DnaJ-class molecular chaperone